MRGVTNLRTVLSLLLMIRCIESQELTTETPTGATTLPGNDTRAAANATTLSGGDTGAATNATTMPVNDTGAATNATTMSVNDTGSATNATTMSVNDTGSSGQDDKTAKGFDHETMWLNFVVDACDLQNTPSSVFLKVVQEVEVAIQGTCKVSGSVVDVTTIEDKMCLIKLKAKDNSAHDALESCLNNKDVPSFSYDDIVHRITPAATLLNTTAPAPSTSRLLRKKLNTGLDPALLDDESVIKLRTQLNESDMLNDFEDNVKFLNTVIDQISVLLKLDSQENKSIEIIGLHKDEKTGAIDIALRPISADVITEERILKDLKVLAADPDSGLYKIEGISELIDLSVTTMNPTATSTTTTITTSTTGVSTTMLSTTRIIATVTTSTTTVATKETEQNWPLIGGLVGGIGGAAAVAGGLGVFFSRRNKSDALVPDNPANQVVLTPNTRHASEGTLIERTPRGLTPRGGGFD